MMTDRSEHQLPVDAVKEALEVEIEHSVVTPTTLTSCAHGIDRRFAWAIAVGVGMEHRFRDRLQIASGDLLGNAVRNRRNTQRSRPAIRLWNEVDPVCETAGAAC